MWGSVAVQPAGVWRRRSPWLDVAYLAVVGALSAACLWPVVLGQPLAAATILFLTVAMTGGALAVRTDPDVRHSTPLLLVGPLYGMSWAGTWGVGPLPLLAFVSGMIFWPTLIRGILHYPYGRMRDRAERAFVVLAHLWMLGPALGNALIGVPAFYGMSPGVWWPTVAAHEPTWTVVRDVSAFGDALVGLCFAALMVRRVVRARGTEQLVLAPVMLGTAALAVGIGMLSSFTPYPGGPDVSPGQQVMSILLLGMVATLLAGAVQRRVNNGAVAELLVQVGGRPSLDGVEAALRRVLRDPLIDLHYWDVERGRYVDPDGQESMPAVDDHRTAVPVQTGGGQHLAVVVVDRSFERQRALLGAAVVATALAVENIRLQDDIRAQLEEVRRSRERIVAATIAERTRLERDLHDGFQQQLIGLGAKLGVAHRRSVDPQARAAIDDARVALRLAHERLRRVVNGVYPAALVQHGLHAAVAETAEQLGISVDPEISAERFDTSLEATAYFVVSEALTNVAKHARTGAAAVLVHHEGEVVVVRISDGGPGGARAEGGGLRGMRDRVLAVGGTLTIRSSRTGTTIEARMPCG